MLFNSAQFLVFFPTVCALYFALPHRYRWLWLLLASCYFYMAFIPAYILILLCVIAVDFTAGLLIERSQGRRRTVWLVISLMSNIGLLGIFKYFNFVNGNLSSLAALLDWNYPIEGLAIALPIGLSFHTFQSMSYTIEVYRGRQPAERHLGIFALYVMFFPQLVAGPIERPQNLLPAGTLEMFSPSYFQASLQALLSGAKFRMPRPLPAESDIDQTYPTVRPDGSWSLSATTRATTPAQVRAFAASYANKKSVSGFGVFSRMEPQAVKVFEAFVRSLRREQVQVILYLGPYHPAAYDVMVRPDKLPLIPTVENYLRAFAAENQLTVVGSYNPAGWAVGTDFYDGIHATEAGARKTFEHRVLPSAQP